MRLTPGDPLGGIVGDRLMTTEEMQLLRARYGLDQPIPDQFATFALGALRGDFGQSIHRYPDRVSTLIRERIPASLLLGGTVLLLNFTIGIALGVWQAVRRGSALDRWLTRLSLAAWAMPSFWLGLVLIAVFSLKLGLFPAGQMQDPLLPADATVWTRGLDLLHHLALPALTLSAVSLAAGMRFQRTAMLEVLRLDFIRAARARGLPEWRVIWVHAWRNALSPVVTLLGLWLPMLVAGSIYVESIFNWPGLGSLAAEAISGRDYPLLLGTAMLTSALVVLGGVLADIGYLLIDPRVREG
jgi:peptide/nickel transport system permease protein